LVPNPIKAQIRKTIREQLNGQSSDDKAGNPSQSMKAVDYNKTDKDINSIRGNIDKLGKF
jgi:hypothetical protein